MALALGLTTVTYVLISIGVFGTLTVDQAIGYGETAIAEAARPTLGDAGFTLMAVAALIATAGATNGTLFGSAGLTASLSEIGQFPPILGTRSRLGKHGGLLVTASPRPRPRELRRPLRHRLGRECLLARRLPARRARRLPAAVGDGRLGRDRAARDGGDRGRARILRGRHAPQRSRDVRGHRRDDAPGGRPRRRLEAGERPTGRRTGRGRDTNRLDLGRVADAASVGTEHPDEQGRADTDAAGSPAPDAAIDLLTGSPAPGTTPATRLRISRSECWRWPARPASPTWRSRRLRRSSRSRSGALPRQRRYSLRVRPTSVDLDAIARLDSLVEDALDGRARRRRRARGRCGEIEEHPATPSLAARARRLRDRGRRADAGAGRRVAGGRRLRARRARASAHRALRGAERPGRSRWSPRSRRSRPASPPRCWSELGVDASADVITLAALVTLLPGMTLTIGMRELATEHLQSGVANTASALVQLFGLAFGVAVGHSIASNWFGVATGPPPPRPGRRDPARRRALLAALAFTVTLQARSRDALGDGCRHVPRRRARTRPERRLFGDEAAVFVAAV